jgi:hypothetical protein
MYFILVQYLDKRLANIIAPIIYVLMMLAIGYCIFEPQAEFKYLNL